MQLFAFPCSFLERETEVSEDGDAEHRRGANGNNSQENHRGRCSRQCCFG